MKPIPLYHYIAWNNPDGARAVIESFGYEIYNVRDRHDLAVCVRQLINQKGSQALEALAHVHPDRDLILACNESLSANGERQQTSGTEQAVLIKKDEPSGGPSISKDYTVVLIAAMFFSALLVTAAIIVKN